MDDETIVQLIDAGPLTVITIAFLAVALVTLILAVILLKMLKSFLVTQKEGIKQTQLTRRAIEKLDRNHAIEIQKLSLTMEAINLSLTRRRMVDRREFYLLRKNIDNVKIELDNFVPKVVEALSEVIKRSG